MPYVVECAKPQVDPTAVPGSAVLKQKQEPLTQPLLQKVMSVFDTCDFENSFNGRKSALFVDPAAGKDFNLCQFPLPAGQGKQNK